MNKKIAVVFPGQGSQSVGMGLDFYNSNLDAVSFFDHAFDLLGDDFKKVCFEGPKETLTMTQYAQPLIFTLSVVIYESLKALGLKASYFSGHSLGELSAYYASGALSFEESLRLIQKRGYEMAASYPSEDSAMCAVMGMDIEQLKTILSACVKQPVVAANFNCPGQIVISGTKDAVSEARDKIKEQSGKCIPLPVSGAFHSPLMEQASAKLEGFVNELDLKTPTIPIVLNRTATAELNPEKLRENIALQVKSSVYWQQSMTYLEENGVELVIECGPAKVLSKLIQKSCSLDVFNVNSLESLNELKDMICVD